MTPGKSKTSAKKMNKVRRKENGHKEVHFRSIIIECIAKAWIYDALSIEAKASPPTPIRSRQRQLMLKPLNRRKPERLGWKLPDRRFM
jgi:hypothetical protein